MYNDPAGNTAFSHSVLSSSLTSLNTEGEMRERPAIVGPQNWKGNKERVSVHIINSTTILVNF